MLVGNSLKEALLDAVIEHDDAVMAALQDFVAETGGAPLTPAQRDRIMGARSALKEKAKTLPALLDQARFAMVE